MKKRLEYRETYSTKIDCNLIDKVQVLTSARIVLHFSLEKKFSLIPKLVENKIIRRYDKDVYWL